MPPDAWADMYRTADLPPLMLWAWEWPQDLRALDPHRAVVGADDGERVPEAHVLRLYPARVVELVLQDGDGTGGVGVGGDVGPPQLPADEEQQEGAGRDHQLTKEPGEAPQQLHASLLDPRGFSVQRTGRRLACPGS